MRTDTTKAAMACLLVGLGACSDGPDPDPRAIARELRAASPSLVDERPPLQVAALFAPGSPPPAPMGEGAPAAAVRWLQLPVGRQAQHVVDARFLQEFGAGGEFTVAALPCSDHEAVEQLLLGRGEFAVIGGSLGAREQQAGLQQTRLGVELFALAVAEQSPLRSLTRTQVRAIFTGQVTSWSELGHAGGDIVPLVPGDRAVGERAATLLIPGDPFGPRCLGLAEVVLVRQLRLPGTIGIVRVTGRTELPGLKLLQIDGSPATPEAFAYGSYPFGVPLTLVTAGQGTPMAANFLAFARSAAGRELLAPSVLMTH